MKDLIKYFSIMINSKYSTMCKAKNLVKHKSIEKLPYLYLNNFIKATMQLSSLTDKLAVAKRSPWEPQTSEMKTRTKLASFLDQSLTSRDSKRVK